MTLVVHDWELDADCYKVRLMLGVLGLAHETVAVNGHPGVEQPMPPLPGLDLRSTPPVLVDGSFALRGAEPILAYLARRYDPMDHWLPADDPALFGEVMMWLFFGAESLRPAALARLGAMFDVEADATTSIRAAKAAFRSMEDHMTAREFDSGQWFVGGTPTLADIALFPSIALSRDSGIEHDAYPALRRWMRRVRAIPGFRTMPGIPDYH